MSRQDALSDPYSVAYRRIDAVTSADGSAVELIETPSCWGGAYWAMAHIGRGRLVRSSEQRGVQARYLLSPGADEAPLAPSALALAVGRVEVGDDTVEVTYRGLGGAGMGATSARGRADGVLRAEAEASGGGRPAEGTLVLPRRFRVLVALDDTDSPTEGATWALAHNLGEALDGECHRYLGHTIVQLFPVAERTQNCTATVVEFGSTRPDGLAERAAWMVERHALSPHWGMACFEGFDPSALRGYSRRCREGAVSMEECLRAARDAGARLWGGRGRIGALAALAWFDRPREAVVR